MVAGVASAQPVVAPAAQPAQPQRDEIIIRTYNVADLMRMTSDYPLDTQALGGRIPVVPAGGGGGNLFGNTGVVVGTLRTAPPIEMDPLAQLLITSVSPETWSENGGVIGRISKLSTMLVVTQTRKNHETIQQLLDEIRRSAGPTQVVTLRATWVQTSARDLLTPTTEVAADWLAKQKTYCESQITCFSGQMVHMLSGADRNVISDLTPVVGTNSIAFDPTARSVLTGVAMQLTPQLIPNTESAILDVQSSVSEQGPEAPAYEITGSSTEEGARLKASIDRIMEIRQQFKTTARIPLRKKVIVGGITIEPASAAREGRQLYLVVEMDTVK